MKRIEISIDSPAGRTVCALAEQLNLDPQDVLQGILFGLCNRKKRQNASPSPHPGYPSTPISQSSHTHITACSKR